jgi:hypothetical protein
MMARQISSKLLDKNTIYIYNITVLMRIIQLWGDFMRKYILCLILSLCLIFFASCSPSDASHLNLSDYGEAFREKNDVLFPNSDCEHALIHSPLSRNADPSVALLYHQISCKWGGCDYEVHNEPHIFLFRQDELPTARAYYKENGSLYHSFNMACEECYGTVTLHVRCQKQNADCGAGEFSIHAPAKCFEGCDWSEIFRDTPYRIMIESDS